MCTIEPQRLHNLSCANNRPTSPDGQAGSTARSAQNVNIVLNLRVRGATIAAGLGDSLAATGSPFEAAIGARQPSGITRNRNAQSRRVMGDER